MIATPDPGDRLDQLGDALWAATAADVARAARTHRRRTLAATLAASAIVLPGAALATQALISDDDVARSIPRGAFVLAGTDPTCTTVRANVEFDCVLAHPPRAGDVQAGAWRGTLEETVDDTTLRVNGGCRSLDSQGTHWRCYIGQEAVRQGVIGATLLGESVPLPPRG